MLTVAFLVTVTTVPPAHAASEGECRALWKAADLDGDDVLLEWEARRFAVAMHVRDPGSPADGKLTLAAFLDACKAGAYAPTKAETGAPLKGANSFTEGQARDRALAWGATNLSSLAKDPDGIWRGTAMWDGRPGQIAVDYKGNVVFRASP
ncbi:MAG: hypothetical protein AB7F22_29755 [Reyranella sp.]|uniref:hypothetical protein n=1 Tax=Reyranella sp. TaxID=1929291 RepID=UPI003D128CF5